MLRARLEHIAENIAVLVATPIILFIFVAGFGSLFVLYVLGVVLVTLTAPIWVWEPGYRHEARPWYLWYWGMLQSVKRNQY